MPSRVVPCRVYKKALKRANVVQSSEENSVASAFNDSSKSLRPERATAEKKEPVAALSIAEPSPAAADHAMAASSGKPARSPRPALTEPGEPAPPTPLHIQPAERSAA